MKQMTISGHTVVAMKANRPVQADKTITANCRKLLFETMLRPNRHEQNNYFGIFSKFE